MKLDKIFPWVLGVTILFVMAQQKPEDKNFQEALSKLDNRVDELERRLGMSYTPTGEIAQEGERVSSGYTFHAVSGECTLASGVDTITLSGASSGSRADVIFRSADSYRGYVTPTSDPSGKSYSVVPLSGTQFIIVSSDMSDVSIVRFYVEGE